MVVECCIRVPEEGYCIDASRGDVALVITQDLI